MATYCSHFKEWPLVRIFVVPGTVRLLPGLRLGRWNDGRWTLERGEALDAPVMSERRDIPTSVVTKMWVISHTTIGGMRHKYVLTKATKPCRFMNYMPLFRFFDEMRPLRCQISNTTLQNETLINFNLSTGVLTPTVKLNTHFHLVPRLRIVELYSSPLICVHGVDRYSFTLLYGKTKTISV
jgi:hypothetical protein